MRHRERRHATNGRRLRASTVAVLTLVGSALPAIAWGAGAAGALNRVRPHVGCTDSWKGGSGSWAEGSNWSTGTIPGVDDNVCITAAGTYTVTLMNADISIGSLQLGGASGTQTLDLISNATTSTSLNMTAPSVINANGVLSLYSTQYTTYLRDTTITNDGTLETSGAGSFTYDEIYSDLTNDAGGTFLFGGINVEIPNNTVTTNDGTFDVAAGTDVLTEGGSFVQQGGVLGNEGTLDVDAATFVQEGGSAAPLSKPVTLTNSTLVDTGGATGSFDLEGIGPVLQGTVQPKQTVTVDGAANDAETTLRGSVTNRGVLVVQSKRGDFSELTGGRLVNRGHAEFVGGGSVEVQSAIVNEHGARLMIATPVPAMLSGRTTNDGTLALARGAKCDLGGGALVDGAGATTDVVVDAGHGVSSFISGSLHLKGTLSVAAVGTPKAGSRYVLVHSATVAGTFASVHGGAVAYRCKYTSSSVTLDVLKRA